jgi:sulfate-transporting ATPase
MLFSDPSVAGLDTGLVVSAPRLFGIDMNSVTSARPFGLFVLAVFLLTALLVTWVRRSSLGMRFLAIRANERGAAAAGISVIGTKLAAFSLAGAIAGLAGGLMAYRALNVTFDGFTALASITYLSLAYLGGITSVGGALTAGILLVSGGVISHLFGTGAFSTTWIPVLSGLGTMQIVVTQPEGLAGTNAALLRWARRALARGTGGRTGARRLAGTAPAPGAVEDSGASRPTEADLRVQAPEAQTGRRSGHG